MYECSDVISDYLTTTTIQNLKNGFIYIMKIVRKYELSEETHKTSKYHMLMFLILLFHANFNNYYIEDKF